ncbi:MAG: di-trans,poly-cis-decaprenylcistransferase [Chlamydiae bacterium RIFCSPHIGHO2_12_FULL_44_59]|nr:MAG: di-trans,poly-cis-decaprenylcistransferase [Chlamydiae bacterium RIFCSPHIGHO2_01_FULL_44_39]OGN58886.1 MAG: di-trans,poly-cis-decaprenylcistransferase [Chlamydiae bacterium RIFCSPHIGHO2_02_FULL_45_9]OGN60566.1 MAG: di-trans,poly-cis-decaprenylcistransferase [Chlamydiae bacterium RIFCSPHIGHO2_12_FULL_44_59]OGN66016.1 MAG: di-trans,poly-cis-decaprenylcistransferase [Chlamydiae bacterium RIFCSPLOWO2_01_FULL_44_52]OGN68832.1 MAG: di-trans,poly-cis-decaprenylcistransferase [Chlamydiae bacter
MGVLPPTRVSELDLSKIPQHVAIIMDGNRRWAMLKGLPAAMGHWEGAEVLETVLRGAAAIGVKTLTVYAFSTENWGRPEEEVDDLMEIFQLYLKRKKTAMIRDGVRLHAIGDLTKLPEKVQQQLDCTRRATDHCDRINLVLALNYGGRDEIRRAVVKMIEKNLTPNEVTEECIAKHLDTSPFGDPDLLIRTSGEMRVSNFLLWQISYTEFLSTQVLWPDFSAQELFRAVYTFQNRSRRLGE